MKADFFAEFPRLETERLILRQLTSADAEAMFGYLSDPEVARYLSAHPHRNVAQTAKLIDFLVALFKNRDGLRWGITLKEVEGKIIGTCGFHAWAKEHRRAEIGYELARDYWRQGLMAEAIRAILSFGFAEMGLNRVEAMVLVGNTSSAGFLERQGFQKEARLREYEFVQGKFRDILLFSILSEAYPVSHLTA